MDYVWHLWYDATWPESTLKRFQEDVKDLLNQPLPHNIFIPDSNALAGLKAVWTEWLAIATTASVEDVLADRYDT